MASSRSKPKVLSPAAAIGIVSDTHLPRFGRSLPPLLVKGLTKAGVAAIVHCGDHTDRLAAELLGEIAPVFAVAGNNDPPPLHRLYGDRIVVELGGFRVGVVHGHAGRGRSTLDRAYNAFADDPVNVVLYGHSHIPFRSRRDGVLLFNPGSPTDKRFNPAYSYGILRLDGERIRVEHKFYLRRT